MRRVLAAGTVAALGVAAVAVTAPAAQADRGDRQEQGTCANGTFEFQVEREDGGYDVSVDLDRLTPGSAWKVVMRQDGKRISKVTRTADEDGDVEVSAWRSNTAGSDRFAFRATPAGGGKGCSATITVR